MIKSIVCCATDFGIGKANGLLFDIPEDMKHFKEATKGKVCVFGYSTYLSLSKQPLPHRINVVLWDKATSMDSLDGAITFSNFEALLKFIQILAKELDVYICGGASLYKLFMPYYDEIDITFVDAVDKEATAFFPDLSKSNYVPIMKEVFHETFDKNGQTYLMSNQRWVKNFQGYIAQDYCIIK